MDGLLDSRGLAQHLGVSLQSLHKMRQRGQVPAPLVLGNRRLRWRSSDIEAWLASLAEEANPSNVWTFYVPSET